MADDERLRRVIQLKAAFDRGALDPAGEDELRHLLVTDPACRAYVGRDIVMHRLLALQADAPAPEAVVRELQVRRRAEASASDFMRRIAPRTRNAARRNRRRHGRSRWAVPLLTGAALAALLLAAIGLANARTGTQDLWVVTAQDAVADGTQLDAGRPLSPGMALTTGAEGSLHIAYADGSELVLDRDSRLRVVTITDGKRLELDHGAVEATVAPQESGAPFVIVTPHGRATVLGTRFRLEVDQRSRLSVREGRVRLNDLKGGSQDVTAGGVATVSGDDGDGDALTIPDGALVHYDFREADGDRVPDRSGHGLDLVIDDPTAVTWLPAGGLRVDHSTRLRSQRPASDLVAACQASGALSIVAEIVPCRLPADHDMRNLPLRIVCLPGDLEHRNFNLGQGLFEQQGDVFDFRLRTDRSDTRGKPSATTAAGVAVPRRMLLVVTRDVDGTCRLSIDGRRVPVQLTTADYQQNAPTDSVNLPGSLSAWDPSLHLMLAADNFDQHGIRGWTGTYHRILIYPRVLGEDEIQALRMAR